MLPLQERVIVLQVYNKSERSFNSNASIEILSKHREVEVKGKMDCFINKTVCSEGHAKKITQLIVEVMVLDLRPVAMIESNGFRCLINYV